MLLQLSFKEFEKHILMAQWLDFWTENLLDVGSNPSHACVSGICFPWQILLGHMS